MRRLVMAITGASGAIYARRLLQVLLKADCEVHLTLSHAAIQVFHYELATDLDANQFSAELLLADPEVPTKHLHYHKSFDFSAGIASGSFQTDGMIICPCSMGTLGSLAHGLSANLIHRAADVHLKERRKLILVPRETPLGSIQLDNMKRLADAGAVILPAMPGFYHQPESIDDLVNFVVARICDHLHIDHKLTRRWGNDK